MSVAFPTNVYRVDDLAEWAALSPDAAEPFRYRDYLLIGEVEDPDTMKTNWTAFAVRSGNIAVKLDRSGVTNRFSSYREATAEFRSAVDQVMAASLSQMREINRECQNRVDYVDAVEGVRVDRCG